MSNPTLIITSISVENNYLRIEGTIQEPGSKDTRKMISYYVKSSTTFNIQEQSQITGKGTIYTNFFSITNHLGGNRINISELLIGNVTQGTEGKAFTSQTFTTFMTENTGA